MRAARWFVLISALTGLGVQVWLGGGEMPLLRWMPVTFFLICAVIARFHEATAFALPLAVAFVVPAVFQAFHGRFFPAYHAVWFAAMLGAVAGAPGSLTRWSLPRAWILPLGLWAMVIAVAWPIVVAREADFTAAWLTRVYHMANSSIGGPPPVIAVWVVNCALTLLAGLLWFDRLFAYADDAATFRRWVVLPLALGAIASGALGMYQGLVDLNFLNGHQWPELRRAGGGLVDADGFGAGAGFFSSAFVALAAMGGPVSVVVGTLGAIVSWAGLWASGSRMAMLAGLIGLGGIAIAAAVVMFRVRRRWPLVVAIVAFVALIAAGAFAARTKQWSTESPIARAMEVMPAANAESIKHFVKTQLFDRGAPYGTATVWMFLQSPLVGVGIGTFNGVFPDYSVLIVGKRFSFDNAQSWYRQQFAEMGLLGSAGWVWWLATVGWLLLRTGGAPDRRFAAIVIKGSLAAIAIVTAVSLPTQDAFVALLPWLMVFWYLQLSPDARGRLAAWRAPSPLVSGVAVWVWAAAFAMLTYSFGVNQYRPSMRAAWANWPYTAGFSDEENEPDPRAPGTFRYFQWSEGHAVQTLAVKGPWLRLIVSGGPPDIAAEPARLTISRRYKPIVSVVRSSPDPLTYYIAPGTEKQVIIGIDTSRTYRPGGDDKRELGVRLEWAFVDDPPPGAVVIR